jgi:hypothetical protein
MILVFVAAILGATYLLDARRAETRYRIEYRAAFERRLQSLGLS